MIENIGKLLKDARKGQNKSFEDIHDQTRVSIEHLKMLEQNNFAFLPETYVKSFLKSYAEALGLNSREILAAYQKNREQEKAEAEEQAEREEAPQVAPVKRSVRTPAVAGTPGKKRNVVEWALGIGSVVLIALLVLIYLQYKSKLYAKTSEPYSVEKLEKPQEFAEIELRKPTTHVNGQEISPLELEITAKQNIWISLKIDEGYASEYELSPKENLVWMAEKRFDVTIGKKNSRALTDSNAGSGHFELVDGTVSFTLSSKSLENENKTP